MISLRSKDISLPIIGKPRSEALSMLKLPTNRDVLQRFTFFMKVEKTPVCNRLIKLALKLLHFGRKLLDKHPKATPVTNH